MAPRKFYTYITVLTVAVALVVVGCKKDDPDPPHTNGDDAPCDTTNVGYTSRVNQLITTKCRGCHNDIMLSGGLSLTGYAPVRELALSGALMHSVNGTGGFALMPPNGNVLTACEKQVVQLWIDNGAEED